MLHELKNVIPRRLARLEVGLMLAADEIAAILAKTLMRRRALVKWFADVLSKVDKLEVNTNMTITHLALVGKIKGVTPEIVKIVGLKRYRIAVTRETLHVKDILLSSGPREEYIIIEHNSKTERPLSCCELEPTITRIAVEKEIMKTVFYNDYATEQEYIEVVKNIVARNLDEWGLTPPCSILNCLVLADFVARNLDTIFEAVERRGVRRWP